MKNIAIPFSCCPYKKYHREESHDVQAVAEALLNYALKGENPGNLKVRAAICLFLCADVNIAEMRRLKVGDYDPAARDIIVDGVDRVVLDELAVRILDLYISRLRENNLADSHMLLFPNKNGDPVSRQCLWGIIKKAMNRTGARKAMVPSRLQGIFLDRPD